MAKTIPEEQRKKISESMKGRKLSEEHKAKLRESMKKVIFVKDVCDFGYHEPGRLLLVFR